MFEVGDLVQYGGMGVCRVRELRSVSAPRTQPGGQAQLYYVLQPLYQNCEVSIPVDNKKVLMRPVITREEALALIDAIPDGEAEIYHNSSFQRLAEHYRQSIVSCDCGDLLELTRSLYAKKREAESRKKKLGVIDERFMRRAEELLFGELAVALEIEREAVPDYIAERLSRRGG